MKLIISRADKGRKSQFAKKKRLEPLMVDSKFIKSNWEMRLTI